MSEPRKPELQELHLKLMKGEITPKEYADLVRRSVDLRIERSRRARRQASAQQASG